MTVPDGVPPVREIMGVGGEIVVLGPADTLIIKLPEGFPEKDVNTLFRACREQLGSGRYMIFGADVGLGVARAEEPEVDPQTGWIITDDGYMVVPDRRPHSRACGIRKHDHGPDCHRNCPTCGGR